MLKVVLFAVAGILIPILFFCSGRSISFCRKVHAHRGAHRTATTSNLARLHLFSHSYLTAVSIAVFIFFCIFFFCFVICLTGTFRFINSDRSHRAFWRFHPTKPPHRYSNGRFAPPRAVLTNPNDILGA